MRRLSMAKYEKTIATLEQLRDKQSEHGVKAHSKDNYEKAEMFDARVTALNSALRLLNKRRQEMLSGGNPTPRQD
jgi:hypothetical protein